jgi:hypothetical protein
MENAYETEGHHMQIGQWLESVHDNADGLRPTSSLALKS